ncbi:hypothetical protein ASC75_23860 [Aminobacter sp. DSM 101952]|nr:hypothetical protein ASC75_23860 [Aminobacter sp. DSM 101952]
MGTEAVHLRFSKTVLLAVDNYRRNKNQTRQDAIRELVQDYLRLLRLLNSAGDNGALQSRIASKTD